MEDVPRRASVLIGCRAQSCDMFGQANSQSNLRTNKAPTLWDPDTVIKQILVMLLQMFFFFIASCKRVETRFICADEKSEQPKRHQY